MMEPSTQNKLEGQVAIVTGATAGIGREVCLALARHGANVVVTARNRKRIDQTVADCRRQPGAADVLGLSCDVRNEQDMQRMADETVKRFGRIDILAASAGILRAKGSTLKTLAQMTCAEWCEVLDVNLKGLFLANRAVLPAMIRQRCGHVLNLSSTSGRKAYAFDSAYCASKFGAIGLTESLAAEVRSHGVKVQILLPGAIDTPMWDQNGPIRRPEFALPVQRVADMILHMLTIPRDTLLLAPMIEPLGKPQRGGWLGDGPDRRSAPVPARQTANQPATTATRQGELT